MNPCPFGCGEPHTPLHFCKQGGTSGRALVAFCSTCNTSWELGFVDHRDMPARGFVLIEGAWTGLCESCAFGASDAEYEALVTAAAVLSLVHTVGPLSMITIPEGEDFSRPGETVFGFWAVVDHGNGAAERFRKAAHAIVDDLNKTRGTELLVNLNDTGTQAVVHGIAG